MREKVRDSIGFRLIQVRKFLDMRQVDFADIVQTNVSVIRRFEGNISMPSAESLLAIQRATKCNLHWLLTGQGSMMVNAAADDPRHVNHPALVGIDATLSEIDALDKNKTESVLVEFKARAQEVKRVAELELIMMQLSQRPLN